MIKKLIYSLLFVAALWLVSCSNECSDCDFDPVRPKHSRVLFHYLAMDNNLSSAGQRNLSDMLRGATAENMNDGAIVVFNDMPRTNSQLLYIHADKNGAPKKDTIYIWDKNLDASNPKTFTIAYNKMRELVDADSWALGAGSHGTGWMPFSMQDTYMTVGQSLLRMQQTESVQPWYIRDPFGGTETRALIQDNATYMNIDDLIAVIPDNTFDFVMLDLCFMGGVEFAYAMRNKTKQLILSPAEVMVYGMPYDRILKHIFAKVPRLGEGGVSEEFYNYYLNDFADAKFATIAVYDCSKLDALAAAMRAIVIPERAKIEALTTADLNSVQTFDGYKLHTIFDLKEFVDKIHTENDEIRQAFDTALSAVVTYKKTTGNVLNGTRYQVHIPEDRYCGISTYIPISQYATLNEYYWKTEWAKTVYSEITEGQR